MAPHILVLDSGLGGLTVYREILRAIPQADYLYVADDAGFPYGGRSADDLVWRVLALMRRCVEDYAPDMAVVACNTISTLLLPHLRAAFPDIPFVGTVPAIKPAAAQTQSGAISVLATPGTVARDYTRDLIAAYASHCAVALVGSQRLAPLAERFMRGAEIEQAEVAAEIAPCFVRQTNGARTDTIVLACTHYPLLLDMFRQLAPWPVNWIDPAPAIARRAAQVLAEKYPGAASNALGSSHPATKRQAVFTSGTLPSPELARVLDSFSLVGAPFAPALL